MVPFLSHHLAVSVHSALLHSVVTQCAAPTLFLIEAADCVSLFALHYYSHAGCVISSCFLSAFYTAVNHSCSHTGAVPSHMMCFLSGNAVAWNFKLGVIRDYFVCQTLGMLTVNIINCTSDWLQERIHPGSRSCNRNCVSSFVWNQKLHLHQQFQKRAWLGTAQ